VRGRELDLLDRGHHLPHVKTADLLHFKGRSVEVPVLPPELVRVGVVLEVLLRVYIGKALLAGTRETKMF
jgi:hypothetical protein